MMKEICAVIRAGKWADSSRELKKAGFHAMTRHRVMGRGRQKGLAFNEDGSGVRLLPKWMLILIVEEAQVDQAVAALLQANQSGEIGDGKIFVSPVSETLRVRTEEIGYPALC